MVKGRQNLELLLKLVAEFHGIQLDNTAQAVANAKAGPEKNVFLAHRRQGRRVKKVMTHQQFRLVAGRQRVSGPGRKVGAERNPLNWK